LATCELSERNIIAGWKKIIWRIGGMILTGENCPSATVSTTNLTWTALEMNPGLHGEKPVTTTCAVVYYV
jgi:hypothetical protein